MTTFFVTRHAGAREWARRRHIEVDAVVEHLDPVQAGDRVLGTLPVSLAADVCARDARYFHLLVETTAVTRGRELSADELEALGASLAEYDVRKVPNAS